MCSLRRGDADARLTRPPAGSRPWASIPLAPTVRALQQACAGDAREYVHFGVTTLTEAGPLDDKSDDKSSGKSDAKKREKHRKKPCAEPGENSGKGAGSAKLPHSASGKPRRIAALRPLSINAYRTNRYR